MNNDPRAQVQAFLDILKEQHDLDEQKIRRIVEVAQKNGRVYVAWSAVVSILIAVVGFLAIRQLESIEKRLDTVETRQLDVRERLLAVERVVIRHVDEAAKR